MMRGINRRTFLHLTGGALAGISGAGGWAREVFARDAGAVRVGRGAGAAGTAGGMTPGRWSDAVIVNALGGLGDPNRPPADNEGREDWTHGSRVMREAAASGLTAVNVTLGYVAGEGEPFEATIRDLANTDADLRTHSTD